MQEVQTKFVGDVMIHSSQEDQSKFGRYERIESEFIPKLEDQMNVLQNSVIQVKEEAYSHLFPSHLYLNRQNLKQSENLMNLKSGNGPSQPFIGKDASLDSYDKVPIEDFGKNILSRLGWNEGKVLGRESNQQNAILKPIEYTPRPAHLGLGAKPPSYYQKDKSKNMNINQSSKQQSQIDTSNINSLKIGSEVYILSGTHEGLEGKIISIKDQTKSLKDQQKIMGEEVLDEVDDEAYLEIELNVNCVKVQIKKKKVMLLSQYQRLISHKRGEKENGQSRKQEIESKSRSHSKKKSRSRSVEHKSSNKKDKKKKKKHQKSRSNEKKLKKLKWVLPGIVVRVISKKVEDGKLYYQKMRVVDVLDKYQFLLAPLYQEGQSQIFKNEYKHLREKDIETVIPKNKDQEVIVLKGKYRGEIGKILTKDMKKEEVLLQIGIQDLVKLNLDDCSLKYEDN